MASLLRCLAILTVVVHMALGSRCPSGGWFYDCGTRMCYKVVIDKKTWMDARDVCRADDGDLVKFTTEDDLPTIIKFPAIIPENKNFWIGLNDRNEEGVFRWNNGKDKATYFQWAGGYPKVQGGKRGRREPLDCVAILKEKETIGWYNKKCNNDFSFICQRLTNEKMEDYMYKHEPELNVTCPDGWTRVTKRRKCVKIVRATSNYNDAMHKCHDDYEGKTSLLDIPDFEVNDFFRGKLGNENYWIAPTDQVKEGVFTSTTLPGAKQVTYLPWSNEKGRGKKDNCVLLHPGLEDSENYFWDVECKNMKPYICQYDPPAPTEREKLCPEGWKKFARTETCFKVENVKLLRWRTAREECRGMGGDLATIPYQETLDFVKGIVSDNHYWIGLVDEGNDGTFSWVTKDKDTNMDQLNSLAGSDLGDRDCVVLMGNKDGRWTDKSCQAKKHYICEKEATLPPRHA